MSTLTYKCPSCGAPLIYEGARQEMQCNSCGNSFAPETVRKVNEIESADAGGARVEIDVSQEGFTPEEAQRTKTFSCSSCGAQLLTDETTVATNCAFCGSPSIIPDQFSPGTRPETIIPFKVPKEQAERQFHGYFKGRKLIPNLFLQGKNRIEEIRQLYVPFWLFNARVHGTMTFNGTRIHTMRQGQYMVTTTQHFLLHRAGSMDFQALPIDASELVPNEITETLEPYRTEEAINFSPETLSGAMANRASVDAKTSMQRAYERMSHTTRQALRSTVGGYTAVSERSAQVSAQDGHSSPTLFPIWIITTKKEGKLYTFAINGQTGELTCDIPYSKAKFFGWMLGIGAVVAIIAFIVVTMLIKTGVMS